MKKYILITVSFIFALIFYINHVNSSENDIEKLSVSETEQVDITNEKAVSSIERKIVDRPIEWTEQREKLINEYAMQHYGMDITEITPKVVIVHWTASDNCEAVYNYFYNVTMPDDGGGCLNVASHFLVDRDGTIYRLTEETALNRHAIGYNWCAIGIENVGGTDGVENLTAEQLTANTELIKYLAAKYSSIEYVWGHYQQEEAKESGLFIENVPDYYAIKIDPGVIFMNGLRENLKNSRLKFYQE